MKKLCVKDNRLIYLVAILVAILANYIVCIVYNARLFESFLFFNFHDSFMDYFNCLYGYNAGNPFANEASTNYPALAVLFYKLISYGIPVDMQSISPADLKQYQFPWMILIVYTVLLLAICRVVLQYKMQMSSLERIVLELILILSYPVMYAIERGNVINVAFVLTLFFIAYYEDENKILRELAYVALALAAALKLYPAVFGLMLIKRKKIKESIKLVIYGGVGLIVPFVYFGGFSAVVVWLKGLLGFANTVAGGMEVAQEPVASLLYGYNYSLKNIFQVFHYLLTGDFALGRFGGVCLVIYVLILLTAFFTKEKWKELLCYAILIIIVPSFSSSYVTLFLIIPFLVYLNTMTVENKKNKGEQIIKYIFAILMAAILIPWPLSNVEKCYAFHVEGYGPLPFQSILGYIVTCLLIMLLIGDLVKNIYYALKKCVI